MDINEKPCKLKNKTMFRLLTLKMVKRNTLEAQWSRKYMKSLSQIRLSTNTERLRPSESSNNKIIENDVVTKMEVESIVGFDNDVARSIIKKFGTQHLLQMMMLTPGCSSNREIVCCRGKIKEPNVPGNDPMAIEDENEQSKLSNYGH
nr:hypothetical protein [Tanacetum cinerariifolium]